MSAAITSTGQWTKLSTDLTTLKNTAQPFPLSLPALDPADQTTPPQEILNFITEASKGFARSQFEGVDVATGTTFLDYLATILLIERFLKVVKQKGLPGHDGIGSRG